MKCAGCPDNKCYLEGKDCTGGRFDKDELYADEEDLKLLKVSSWLEGSFYMELTRLEEVIRFSTEMGYKRLGLAFCIGLTAEAELMRKILSRDFKVSSVCCKITGTEKETWGLKHIMEGRFEATCNPVVQARILNADKTDLNLIVGLCIGHDILFTKHSKAPVSTFIVKDRVLAHNPAGALYSKYYRAKKFKVE